MPNHPQPGMGAVPIFIVLSVFISATVLTLFVSGKVGRLKKGDNAPSEGKLTRYRNYIAGTGGLQLKGEQPDHDVIFIRP